MATDLIKVSRDIHARPELAFEEFYAADRLCTLVEDNADEVIIASIGPYGPYIKHNNKFVSLKVGDDVLYIGLDRSVHLIAEKEALNKEIEVGIEPESKKKIVIKKGIKGRPDYISFNKKNYSLPESLHKKKISLEDALQIINEKVQNKKKQKKNIKKI